MTLGPIRLSINALMIVCLCVGAGVVSLAMTPRTNAAAERHGDLESLVPERFGRWRVLASQPLVLPDPEADKLQNRIYSSLVARTYAREDGAMVMLVVAYGGDQSDDLQLHRPEICYAANGFEVSGGNRVHRRIAGEDLLLTQVGTARGSLVEPVTYWMRVGGRIVTDSFDRQWVKLREGLSGTIPDGVLVRLSSRHAKGADPGHGDAFALHEQFLEEFVAALSPQARALLIAGGTEGETS